MLASDRLRCVDNIGATYVKVARSITYVAYVNAMPTNIAQRASLKPRTDVGSSGGAPADNAPSERGVDDMRGAGRGDSRAGAGEAGGLVCAVRCRRRRHCRRWWGCTTVPVKEVTNADDMLKGRRRGQMGTLAKPQLLCRMSKLVGEMRCLCS